MTGDITSLGNCQYICEWIMYGARCCLLIVMEHSLILLFFDTEGVAVWQVSAVSLGLMNKSNALQSVNYAESCLRVLLFNSSMAP